MSNYLPTTRRYSKPVAQNPNFVMSSWKLGATNSEDKNGHRKPADEATDSPPAHLFKKFRLEKPTMPPEEEKPVTVKQEVEEMVEMNENNDHLVDSRIDTSEDDQCSPDDMLSSGRDRDMKEPFYGSNEEAPVPLLVCKTSLKEESDGGSWSGTGSSPDMAETGDLPCQRCNKKYKSRYTLNRHVLYECGKARKSFSCDECGKKVTRQDTLQKHKLIHLVQHMKGKELELDSGN